MTCFQSCGFISAWGAWGACSASCQFSFTLPTQTRNRQYIGAIFNGSCNGAVFTDTQNCNEQVYCPDFISARGACSASCQLRFTSPTQTRNRQCAGATFNDNCNGTVLTYGTWSSCSESCQSNHIRRWLRCFSNYGL
ncbi:properdin-like isoform X3 [Hydra vulgaris]|uniref:Properdin-like isoform X3 n=1 Tax=Hydra vulgaris TaxID=6087 RepID=A0ABM4BB48_HYDVU